MPLFRVHVIHSDLSSEKIDQQTTSPQRAAEAVTKQLREAGVSGFKIGKTKVVRS